MENKLLENNLTLLEQDATTIWHPFTQHMTARPPVAITRAQGTYLYDDNEKKYLDAISSWWVNLHGHAHPYIAKAIAQQAEVLEHVIFADFTHKPAVDLASRLLPLLPGAMAKLFFSDNGSTAVEAAIKIALQYWYNLKTPRQEVICLKNSYHGDTFGAMSAAGKNSFNKPFWNLLFNVHTIDVPFAGQEHESLKQLQTAIERGNIACFIFEPLILGSAGMLMYPAQGLDMLMKCCKENQILTIADEVMTGFGRTETLFACEQTEYKPDMMCLSKGLTGGFLPLGATACSQEIYNAFLGKDLLRAFLHGHSYTANPLACVSALASLNLLLEPTCFSRRQEIASQHAQFCSRWKNHPKLQRCEFKGTILAIEYRAHNSSYFHPLRDKIYGFFLEKGILVRPLGNVLYLIPPYCIKNEELEYIYETIVITLEGDL